MQKILFTLLTIQILVGTINSQNCNSSPNWRVTKEDIPSFLNQHDLFFASELVGYTTGVRGTMRKTIDGGKTWKIIHKVEGMGTKANMKTLYFIDEKVGFASGDAFFDTFEKIKNDAEFLRTSNGGMTWKKNFIDSVQSVYDLKFFDTQHGLAICYTNNKTYQIAETHDAGKSWTFLDTKISRVEGLNFILAGARVLVYGEDKLDFRNKMLAEIKENGTMDYSLTTPPGQCSFYFYNDNIGYASTNDKGYKTIDGGITWTEIDLPVAGSWSLVHFADQNNGIIANTIYEAETFGWETWWIPIGLELFITDDGAQTWDRYETGERCVIDWRISHYAKQGEIHFYEGNHAGTIMFDSLNKVNEQVRKISIYPNPVEDYLFLDTLSQDPIQAQIFNVIGQKFCDEKISSKISTRTLNPGYYFLRLFLPKKRIDIPFVKI